MNYTEAVELFDYNPLTGEIVRKGVTSGPARKRGSNRYCRFQVNGRRYNGHRIAWLLYHGEWPNADIDHIDGDGWNNRIENLRDVSKADNQRNAKLREDNKSGITGVGWHARRQKWQAHIKTNKQIYLGIFTDWFDAVCARKAAEHKFNYHPNHGRR